jgi:hypothetical protein
MPAVPSFLKGRPSVKFAAVDELGRRIQCAVDELEAEDKLKRGRYAPPPPRFSGYCARMCQAYKFLALDTRTAVFATDGARHKYSWLDDDSHYWIESSDGVMDLNFGPGETPSESYWPYTSEPRTANSMGFHRWKNDPCYPANQDSRKIMDAVWRTLDADRG